jgi:hypothetical protein
MPSQPCPFVLMVVALVAASGCGGSGGARRDHGGAGAGSSGAPEDGTSGVNANAGRADGAATGGRERVAEAGQGGTRASGGERASVGGAGAAWTDGANAGGIGGEGTGDASEAGGIADAVAAGGVSGGGMGGAATGGGNSTAGSDAAPAGGIGGAAGSPGEIPIGGNTGGGTDATGGTTAAGGAVEAGTAGVPAGGGTPEAAGSGTGGEDLAGGGAAGTATGAFGGSSAAAGSAGAGLGGSGGVPVCASGAACDNGVCIDQSCCPHALACGTLCCAPGQVCSYLSCVTPGTQCADTTDCAPDEYCEWGLRVQPAGAAGGAGGAGQCPEGVVPLEGSCMPLPPQCSEGDPGAGSSCVGACQRVPATTTFDLTVRVAWGEQTTAPFASDVMVTPIVLQLGDDDCDGRVTERDVPEIVVTSFSSGQYASAGVLHAVAVVDGAATERWSVAGVLRANTQLAGGNIDGKPGNEIVGCGADGLVHAFGSSGVELWHSDATYACSAPALGDLDADGTAEVVVEGAILDGATGVLKHDFLPALNSSFVLSDIDSDGLLDVVTASRGYHGDGLPFVDNQIAENGINGSWPAVADVDLDGVPEVVAVYYNSHEAVVWRYDATEPQKFQIMRGPVDVWGGLDPSACPPSSAGSIHGGGPPSVADLDGDGVPDVVTATGVGLTALNGARLLDSAVSAQDTFLWAVPNQDCSSAQTGASTFDFDGDGRSEVVYSDERRLRIYDGSTGAVVADACNPSATLNEYPVVADVDADGHAEIVAVSNAFAGFNCGGEQHSGIRVFGSTTGTWARTRSVWNEHSYHVTNVLEDGTIPASEPAHWKAAGLNAFRNNRAAGLEFAASDAVASVVLRCTAPPELGASIRNVGQAALPAGATVEFYRDSAGSPVLLDTETTSLTLGRAQSQLVLARGVASSALESGDSLYVRVTPRAGVDECNTENNVSPKVPASCTGE